MAGLYPSRMAHASDKCEQTGNEQAGADSRSAAREGRVQERDLIGDRIGAATPKPAARGVLAVDLVVHPPDERLEAERAVDQIDEGFPAIRSSPWPRHAPRRCRAGPWLSRRRPGRGSSRRSWRRAAAAARKRPASAAWSAASIWRHRAWRRAATAFLPRRGPGPSRYSAGLLDQAHAFIVERLERLREDAALREPDGLLLRACSLISTSLHRLRAGGPDRLSRRVPRQRHRENALHGAINASTCLIKG